MTNFDLSPLCRSTVGFDHLCDMLDQASRVQPATWPPDNIERLGDDQYRIVMDSPEGCATEINEG